MTGVTHRWWTFLVIDAHPTDRDQLAADLPPKSEIFYNDGAKPYLPKRTGIVLRSDHKSINAAVSTSLHAVIDSLPNLGNSQVTALEVFTEEDLYAHAAPRGELAFWALLFGSGNPVDIRDLLEELRLA